MNRARIPHAFFAARVPDVSFVFFLVAFLAVAAAAFAEIPRVPFSGAYGSTSGAGSLAGWERLGGENPAAFGAPGWIASLAGYSPFGIEDLGVAELEAARDSDRWGASLGWRAFTEAGNVEASSLRARLAARLGAGWSGGGGLRFGIGDAAGRDGGFAAGLGVLWRPRPFATLGAAWEDGVFGLGADLGAGLGPSGAWRLSYDRFFGFAAESRYGLGLRLHPLLSVHAGLAPARETASLGVRFGLGGWEGFSALRRHAALGGTPVQGVRWTRERAGVPPSGSARGRMPDK